MEIIRGDNDIKKFYIYDSTGNIRHDVVDKVYFTMKKSIDGKEYLQKTLDDGIEFSEEDYYYRISFLPEDTQDLILGDYYYDIERHIGDNVKTISRGNIKITYDITTPKED